VGRQCDDVVLHTVVSVNASATGVRRPSLLSTLSQSSDAIAFHARCWPAVRTVASIIVLMHLWSVRSVLMNVTH
jgi:hypothetical protein